MNKRQICLLYHCYLNSFDVLTVTSSSVSMENLMHLVNRMSLHEGEENELSSHHMLEVPLEAAGKDVDNKEIDEEEKIVGNVASHQKRSRKLTEKGQSLKH